MKTLTVADRFYSRDKENHKIRLLWKQAVERVLVKTWEVDLRGATKYSWMDWLWTQETPGAVGEDPGKSQKDCRRGYQSDNQRMPWPSTRIVDFTVVTAVSLYSCEHMKNLDVFS